MKLSKRIVVLIIIFLIAATLRLYKLGEIPPSPDWDEAALGYNAYSILKTGKDEYGTPFPLSLRSFDDYKPPLYMYLSVPFIRLFGLSVWSIRLPSAVAGISTVLATYLFVRSFLLFDKKKLKEYEREMIALLAMLLLAISPWHIQFSRIAFEANIGVTLNVWALTMFFAGLTSPPFLSVSAALFGLALYAYHSERIFAPLLVLLLAVLYRKQLLKNVRSILVSVVVGFLVVGPLVPVVFNKTSMTRFRGTSSLSDQTALLAKSVERLTIDQQHSDYLGQLLENRRFIWFKTVIDGYMSHFSPKWLFVEGDNPRHHAPHMGMLYLWELPFIILGLVVLWKRNQASSKLLLLWLVAAPVAASPTTELPHGIRSLVFLPGFQIVTSFGLFVLYEKRKSISRFLIIPISIIIVGFVCFNFVYYLHMYFGHTNREYSQSWQYGYKEAIEYARSHRNTYKRIIVSTKLEQPYMFFLFYLAYDPKEYLRQGGTKSGGFAEYQNAFDIYEFRPIDWNNEIHDGSVLYIGTPKEIPSANIELIEYLDGTPAIYIST